jgi:hypothetical protein
MAMGQQPSRISFCGIEGSSVYQAVDDERLRHSQVIRFKFLLMFDNDFFLSQYN